MLLPDVCVNYLLSLAIYEFLIVKLSVLLPSRKLIASLKFPKSLFLDHLFHLSPLG